MRRDAEGMVNLSRERKNRKRGRGREGGREQHAMHINKQDVGILAEKKMCGGKEGAAHR